MTPGDIEAGLRLCRLSHWNQVSRDWEQFLSTDGAVATVAVDQGGHVIGSVAAMRYRAAGAPSGQPTLAWVAMVLVEPESRGRGVGTALLARGLDSVADATTLGLDATPLGQPLYEKLGFRAESLLTRMAREPGPLADAASAPEPPRGTRCLIRPATSADLDAIAALDAEATGLDRLAMLAWLMEGAPELAWIATSGDRVNGALLGRRGHRFSHLGPLVAASRDDAAALVRTCVTRNVGQALIIDVADAQPGWQDFATSLGFSAQRPFARMYRGTWRPGADASRLFASIGPEFG